MALSKLELSMAVRFVLGKSELLRFRIKMFYYLRSGVRTDNLLVDVKEGWVCGWRSNSEEDSRAHLCDCPFEKALFNVLR